MKLRTRLFLWVGILFFTVSAFSLYFDTYTTDRSLKREESQLREKILMLDEEKRQRFEDYLHLSLIQQQAKIDAILLRFSRNPQVGARLFLNPSELKLTAPIHSAFLFKHDRWIDFIQTTKNDDLTSLVIPIDFPMSTTHMIEIDEELIWVVLDSDREMDRPFIGVRLPDIEPSIDPESSTVVDELIDLDWGLTALFDPESLLNFKKIKGVFGSRVEKAASYVKEKSGSKGWIQKDIQEKSKGTIFGGKSFDLGLRCFHAEGEVLNTRIIQQLQRGDQAIMLSVLTGLSLKTDFGPTLFDKEDPKGIARFPKGEKSGPAVFTNEVFFKEKVFNAKEYLKANPPLKECQGLGSSIAVIAPPMSHQIFVGNALELEGSSGEGFLTIAIDTNFLLQDLVLSIGESAFLVSGGQVISAFDAEGKAILNPSKAIPIKKEVLSEKSGLMKIDGKSYYYLHMTPFADLDLHFYIVQLEEKAFALVRSMEEGSRDVIEDVSFNMRLISVISLALVLLILHRLARRITRPITKLAKVTEDVAQGKLEGIEIQEPPKGRHDEVATLIHSFNQMVIGLKEKEKVKSILNKVVSPEIAQEISKGTIRLGGEKRKVTVLFADIRNFTQMSAKLDPQEVIELLNTCMTKISHVIDEFGGVIDKYVGDEVMALFGAPIEKEDSSLKAIQSGLKMIDVLKKWNEERAQNGKEPVLMGIGIHTGDVLVGNMGAENRLNYTVIGSNVNLASRLCSEASGLEILISKETLEEPNVKESIDVEELSPREIKGYDESFTLFRVKGVK